MKNVWTNSVAKLTWMNNFHTSYDTLLLMYIHAIYLLTMPDCFLCSSSFKSDNSRNLTTKANFCFIIVCFFIATIDKT